MDFLATVHEDFTELTFQARVNNSGNSNWTFRGTWDDDTINFELGEIEANGEIDIDTLDEINQGIQAIGSIFSDITVRQDRGGFWADIPTRDIFNISSELLDYFTDMVPSELLTPLISAYTGNFDIAEHTSIAHRITDELMKTLQRVKHFEDASPAQIDRVKNLHLKDLITLVVGAVTIKNI